MKIHFNYSVCASVRSEAFQPVFPRKLSQDLQDKRKSARGYMKCRYNSFEKSLLKNIFLRVDLSAIISNVLFSLLDLI